MLEGDVLLGGEESGGIGIPAHVMERDGLYCDLMLCELMADRGKGLKELVVELQEAVGPLYYHRHDLALSEERIAEVRAALPTYAPQEVLGKVPCVIDHEDGLRLEFEDDSWLLMRASGTEPLLRVYAEAPTCEARDALLDFGRAFAEGKAV